MVAMTSAHCYICSVVSQLPASPLGVGDVIGSLHLLQFMIHSTFKLVNTHRISFELMLSITACTDITVLKSDLNIVGWGQKSYMTCKKSFTNSSHRFPCLVRLV